jgi:hypothetical protein
MLKKIIKNYFIYLILFHSKIEKRFAALIIMIVE